MLARKILCVVNTIIANRKKTETCIPFQKLTPLVICYLSTLYALVLTAFAYISSAVKLFYEGLVLEALVLCSKGHRSLDATELVLCW